MRLIVSSSASQSTVRTGVKGKGRAISVQSGLADPIQLDVLCMALCVTTNLIEADASTKDALRETSTHSERHSH